MKISILGGVGFIGSATIDRLIRDGHELRVFRRFYFLDKKEII